MLGLHSDAERPRDGGGVAFKLSRGVQPPPAPFPSSADAAVRGAQQLRRQGLEHELAEILGELACKPFQLM